MQFRLGKDELPTKTSAFDGLMVVSGEWYSWWTIVLQFPSNYLTGGDSPSIKPSHDDMRNMCKMAFEFLVLQALDLECRCAHLGGACHDAVTGYWLLDVIRKRLRRLLVPRMPRCETSGPLGAELRKPLKEIFQSGLNMEKVLNRVLVNRRALRVLPRLVQSKKC